MLAVFVHSQSSHYGNHKQSAGATVMDGTILRPISAQLGNGFMELHG